MNGAASILVISQGDAILLGEGFLDHQTTVRLFMFVTLLRRQLPP